MNDPRESLTPDDISLVGEALRLTADGPLFPDSEFQTLFGIERDDVRKVLADWPNVDLKDDMVGWAVLGSLNHIYGNPHRCDDLVEAKFGPDWSVIHQLYARVFTAITGRAPPNGYVDRLTSD